jgi:uncharacterized protein
MQSFVASNNPKGNGMQKICLAALACTLLFACSSTPPTQFYILDAVLQPSAVTPIPNQKPRVIGIGPIALPAVLNRKAIVTRGPQQSIQVADNQQWAEPLLDNITHVIARNLTTLNPEHILHAYPWTAFGAVDTRIVIEISRFEAQLGKAVYFDAVWSIKAEQQEKPLKQGRSTLERPLTGLSLAEMVMQMDDILATFCQELSRALSDVDFKEPLNLPNL